MPLVLIPIWFLGLGLVLVRFKVLRIKIRPRVLEFFGYLHNIGYVHKGQFISQWEILKWSWYSWTNKYYHHLIEILFCKSCCFLVTKRNANMCMLQVLMYLRLFTYKNMNLKVLNQVTRLSPFEFCWSAFNSTQYQMS